jgi:hypothetical protein
MPMARPPRQKVEWQQSPWERHLWRPEATFQPTLDLIEELARTHGRIAEMGELVELQHSVNIPFAVDAHGTATFGAIATSDRRSVALTHSVHRAIREFQREGAARIFRQVDMPGKDGSTRRIISVRWELQPRSTASQIKVLDAAVRSGSPYKIEKAWFGLTQRGHEYLSVGYEIARRQRDLAAYAGALEVMATIIPVAMPAPALLAVITPYAVLAVSYPGSRPVHPRDIALAKILDVFAEVSGHTTSGARRGGFDEPVGRGADFVRGIEAIFGVRLMPERSTHAVARAMKRMSGRGR